MREKGKLSGILEQRHTALRYRISTIVVRTDH